jgi:hypothetical protein
MVEESRMAKKTPAVGRENAPSEEVRRFLSENGKRGGMTTRRLIELGKEKAEESGEDIESDVREELQRERKKTA